MPSTHNTNQMNKHMQPNRHACVYDHLIFYDNQCGLCDHSAKFILTCDKHNLFCFAPLNGTTANQLLKNVPEAKKLDSLILIENFTAPDAKIYVQGKAVLRTCRLLGGCLALPGIFFWLPGWSIDWIYRIIAKNRHRFFSADCALKTLANKERFLP